MKKETAVEHVGLLFVAKKAGAQRFTIVARANNQHFSNPPSAPLLTGEGLCHVECHGAVEDARNSFVGCADVKDAFHVMRIPRWLQAYFALPAVLASEVGYMGKVIDKTPIVLDSSIYPVPATIPNGLSWAKFFCQDVTDHCTLAGSADSSSFICQDHCVPPVAWWRTWLGSLRFRWSYAHIWGIQARGAAYPSPAVMQVFSALSCPQPLHVVVQLNELCSRADGLFAPSH